MSDPPNDTSRPLAYETPDNERPASASPTEAILEQEFPGGRQVAALAHDPYAAMRLPIYRLFACTYSLAVIGSQVMSVAIQWHLYQRTGSELALLMVGVAQAVPVITLALPAGHVNDVFSRKRVLMITQVALIVFPLLLAWLVRYGSHMPHYLTAFYSVVLLNAVALTFARPARQAMLPGLVPKNLFSNAVTWNSSMFEVASMLGAAIGGLVIGRWSVPSALVLSAACTTVCLWLTQLLPNQRAASQNEPLNFRTLAAGVRFVWRTELLLAIMTMDLFAVLLGGAVYLMPVFAKDILHVGAGGFGWLRAAPSLGAIMMAMFIARSTPMQRAGRSLLLAVAAFGAATIVFGLSRNFWLSVAMLVLIGAFDNVSVVVRHSLVQLLTPDAMRGRVSAVNQVFIGASNDLGGVESAGVAWLLGPIISVVGGGIGTILVVLAVAFKWPSVRKFGSLQSAAAAQS